VFYSELVILFTLCHTHRDIDHSTKMYCWNRAALYSAPGLTLLETKMDFSIFPKMPNLRDIASSLTKFQDISISFFVIAKIVQNIIFFAKKRKNHLTLCFAKNIRERIFTFAKEPISKVAVHICSFLTHIFCQNLISSKYFHKMFLLFTFY
jgi:hypothetical protein